MATKTSKGRKRVQQGASEESRISPQRITLALQSRFNPIRGLTPERLSRQLDSFKTGYLREAALTWDSMESRDLNLKTVAAKRKKAIARYGWDVLTLEESPEAERQQEVLRYFYNNLRTTDALNQNLRGGVKTLVKQMGDALGKYFAVHEILWRPTPQGLTAELRFCPLWFFENTTGKLRFLANEGSVEGEEMEANGWLVSVGEGLMEPSSVAYIYKHLPLKDWLAFSEKFGMPGVLGETDAKKDTPEWEAMEEAVKSLINDWAAVTSSGSKITLLEAKSGGSNLPFHPLVDYMDRKVITLWRGGDLGTISAGNDATGASLQGDESDMLQEDDADWASETLNEQLDRFVLEYAFGPDVETLAYFKITAGITEKRQLEFRRKVWLQMLNDGVINRILVNLIQLKTLTEQVGLAVNEEYEEPLLPVTESQAANPNPQNPTPNPALEEEEEESELGNESELQQASREQFAGAVAADLQPIRERLAALLQIGDPVIFRGKALELMQEIDRLKEDILKLPASARVLANAAVAEMVNGWESAMKARNT